MNKKIEDAIKQTIELAYKTIKNALHSQYTEVRNNKIFIDANYNLAYDNAWSIIMFFSDVSEFARVAYNKIQKMEQELKVSFEIINLIKSKENA